METSKDGIEDLKGYEGVKYVAYLDTGGVLTGGAGHTGEGLTHVGQKLSKEQVDTWLREDLKEAEEAVQRLVSVPLTQGQFDALVSFVYNIGEGQFKKSTLLRKLNEGNYSGAKMQLHRWIYDNGKIQPGLVKRRIGEASRWDK